MIFSLPGLIILCSLWDIKSIWPKKSIYFFLQLWNITFIKSCLQNLSAKDHHGLIEISVLFLVCKDFRFELHERMGVFIFCSNWSMSKHNPTIFIGHFLSFFWELFLFRWQYLRNRQSTLSSFLLKNLLFVFKSEKFLKKIKMKLELGLTYSVVIKHSLKKIFILLTSGEFIETWWDLLTVIVVSIFDHFWKRQFYCFAQNKIVFVFLGGVLVFTIGFFAIHYNL